ncbi:MAG: allophanate hydrolase subunit 1, partial [Boseongicola sp.]|nr:allophanate hydrolase subunit 1 [Boseongicola sp.]
LRREELLKALKHLVREHDWSNVLMPGNRRIWRIPAVFGGDAGPQLEEAADLASVDPKLAVSEICSEPLRVMTLGFAPGQPYLGSLSENWNIPRQTGLTKRVPVGAITVAIRQIVLFSTATPTGWRQVGLCGFKPFRPEDKNPFALRPGDEIQFWQVSKDEYDEIQANDRSGDGGATYEVIP